MQALTVAGKLDWTGWLRGIVGAFISGGAGAIGAGVAAMHLDTMHDLNVIHLMAWTFVVSGLISLAKFLQTSPTPSEQKQE